MVELYHTGSATADLGTARIQILRNAPPPPIKIMVGGDAELGFCRHPSSEVSAPRFPVCGTIHHRNTLRRTMPLYEYKCGRCLSVISVTRSYKERETEVVCPQCNLISTRIYNSAAVVFKGTGFYRTDNK